MFKRKNIFKVGIKDEVKYLQKEISSVKGSVEYLDRHLILRNPCLPTISHCNVEFKNQNDFLELQALIKPIYAIIHDLYQKDVELTIARDYITLYKKGDTDKMERVRG